MLESPFQALLALRLFAMLSMVSGVFFIAEIDSTPYWGAIAFYIVSYLCIRFSKKGRWFFYLLECLVSLFIGIASNGMVPYQLLVGLAGCGLFLSYDGKIVYIVASVMVTGFLLRDLFSGCCHVFHLMVNYSFIVFACLTGGLIRYAYQMKNRSQQLYQELEASYQKLQEHTQTVKQLAKEEERNRIAREIHDTVGHTVTALIVQLEAARKLMAQAPDKSLRLMQTVEELARSIYQEIRFAIEKMNQADWEKMTLVELCEQVLSDFAKLTRLTYSFEIAGKSPASISQTYKFHLYRILQETLTNAKRHGKATQVRVKLRFAKAGIQLKIEDNGIGSDQLQIGFGLKNLQRRVEDLGGRCKFVTSAGKGFRTIICLPNEQEENDG